MMEGSLKRLLHGGAKELGIDLDSEQVDACFLYIQELKKWNRKVNLTAILEDRDIIIKHFLDSFSFIKGFALLPAPMMLDMGSGAGFPALPIKIILPEMSVTLVESVGKKASFLRHMIRTLGITGAEVFDVRTDQLGSDLSDRFDLVTARAFADMERVLVEGARFLKPGGWLVMSRGPEESIGNEAAERTGYTIERIERVTLPHSEHRRAIWVFRKKG